MREEQQSDPESPQARYDQAREQRRGTYRTGNGGNARPPPMILSSAEFVAGFLPPDYVLERVLQRRFVYSFTGKTGSGKTAILLLASAHVGRNREDERARRIGDHEVEKGRVLYLAGENPDDVRMRWIAMAQQFGFDLDAIDVYFISGVFRISQMLQRIRTEIEQIGNVTLIIVDTSAAFFEGDEENNNVQHGQHARLLRSLVKMPGEPCVVVACHPVKNADDNNLVPRGGGAFLNEMDGNLTARPGAGGVEVHWQGKFRGPDFAPVHFQLKTVTHERLKDSKGRLVPTVIAWPLSEQARDEIANITRSREDEMLVALLEPANCRLSQNDLARRLGWFLKTGEPYHVLVGRILKTLKTEKLITVTRGLISLTREGRNQAEQACSGCLNEKDTPDVQNRNEQVDKRNA